MNAQIKDFELDLGDGQKVTIDSIADVDLDADPITLPDGTVLDEPTAAQLGEAIASRAAKRRGRPSLTAPGEESPRITVRLRPEAKSWVVNYARRTGRRPADVVREAVDELKARHTTRA